MIVCLECDWSGIDPFGDCVESTPKGTYNQIVRSSLKGLQLALPLEPAAET